MGGYREYYNEFWPQTREPIMKRRIDRIRIIDADGVLVQELDGFLATVWDTISRWDVNNYHGLHFGDFNFDSYLDLYVHIRPGGNRDAGDFRYWLWDASLGQFILNEQLSFYMRGNGWIRANAERSLVVVWFSHAGGRHHTLYEYHEGIFVPVEILYWDLVFYFQRDHWPPEWNPPGEGDFFRNVFTCLETGAVEVWYTVLD